MRLNTTQYTKVMLTLLSTLIAETTLANQPINNTHPLNSNSIFSSYIPTFDKLKHGHVVIQLGGFWSSQGKAQDINIQGLVGNQYTLSNHNQANGLFGLGYFIDGPDKDRFQLAYGLNSFYLAPTSISGDIIQEHLYTNLSYNYKVQNAPLYFAAKANIKTNNKKYNVTLDAGIGPNFMHSSNYKEMPKDLSTLPDNAFASHDNVAFTATAGIGLRLNDFFGKAPLECGYRFFYLGQGQLAMNNDQLINTIKTGNVFANAIVCAVTI